LDTAPFLHCGNLIASLNLSVCNIPVTTVLSRRSFLDTGAGATLTNAGCQPSDHAQHIQGSFTGISHAREHLLRDGYFSAKQAGSPRVTCASSYQKQSNIRLRPCWSGSV
jgi:hypothetical protein